MIDFTLNSAGTIYIDLSSDNRPLENATVTCTVVNPAGTTIVNAAVAVEEGEGKYSHLLTSSDLNSIGTYYVTWNVTSPSVFQKKTTITVGYESSYQQTLLDIRHMCASVVEGKDGFFLGEVTSATISSVTDTARVEPDKTHTGGFLYMYAGDSMGQERRITSVTGTTQLNVAPNWSPTPQVGDLYEIHRIFSVEDYNRAIRQAQNDIAEECLVRITDASNTIDSITYEYDIPAGFSHVYGVDVEVFNGHWRAVSPACWGTVMGLRKLTLDPKICWSYSGQRMRLRGLRAPMELLNDATGVDVRPAYLVMKAASYLTFGKMSGRDESGGWSQKHQFFAAEAVIESQNINKAFPNNARRVE